MSAAKGPPVPAAFATASPIHSSIHAWRRGSLSVARGAAHHRPEPAIRDSFRLALTGARRVACPQRENEEETHYLMAGKRLASAPIGGRTVTDTPLSGGGTGARV